MLFRQSPEPLAMEGLMFVAVMIVGCATMVVGSELRPISIIGKELGQGHLYTLTYAASGPATVLWRDAEGIYYTNVGSKIVITSTFNESTGEGQSTLNQTTSARGVIVGLFIDETFSTYVFEKFVGERQLPEVDLQPIGGKVQNYTPHEAFAVGLRYNNLPSDYSLEWKIWSFSFIDHYRMTPILETASSGNSNVYRRYMSELTLKAKGNYQEVSTELEFESQEGIVSAMIQYSNQDMRGFRGTSFAIKQEQNSGPFPEDFLGVATSFFGESRVFCYSSQCTFLCDGFGKDIESVEVRRVSDGARVEPIYMFRKEWYVVSEYQIYPVTDFTQRFVCTATNKRNGTAQKEITLFTND